LKGNSESEVYSPESVGLTSGSNGREDSRRSGSAKSTNTATRFSENDSPGFQFTGTSRSWTGRNSPRLMSSSEGSLARMSRLQVSVGGLKKALGLDCGSSSQESLAKYVQDTSSSRTFQDLLPMAWTSFWLTLNASVIKRSGRFFLKQPRSGHLTREKESLSWPTPRASDARGQAVKDIELVDGKFFRKNLKGEKWGIQLRDAITKFPTPQARDWKGANLKREGLPDMFEGVLNPLWVEWLMGFPVGWTLLDEMEVEGECVGGWWENEPLVGRVATEIPERKNRIKALGNAVVPQCAQVLGYAILELERTKERG